MQTQTTMTTTQTLSGVAFTAKIPASEQTVTGFCDICGKQETGNKESLRRSGWFLGRNEEFCPNCND